MARSATLAALVVGLTSLVGTSASAQNWGRTVVSPSRMHATHSHRGHSHRGYSYRPYTYPSQIFASPLQSYGTTGTSPRTYGSPPAAIYRGGGYYGYNSYGYGNYGSNNYGYRNYGYNNTTYLGPGRFSYSYSPVPHHLFYQQTPYQHGYYGNSGYQHGYYGSSNAYRQGYGNYGNSYGNRAPYWSY